MTPEAAPVDSRGAANALKKRIIARRPAIHRRQRR